jgi:hypothetical protein
LLVDTAKKQPLEVKKAFQDMGLCWDGSLQKHKQQVMQYANISAEGRLIDKEQKLILAVEDWHDALKAAYAGLPFRKAGYTMNTLVLALKSQLEASGICANTTHHGLGKKQIQSIISANPSLYPLPTKRRASDEISPAPIKRHANAEISTLATLSNTVIPYMADPKLWPVPKGMSDCHLFCIARKDCGVSVQFEGGWHAAFANHFLAVFYIHNHSFICRAASRV